MPMGCSFFTHLVLPILLLSAAHTPAFAEQKPYIVYLGSQSRGLEPTAKDIDSLRESHYNLLGSFLGSNEKAHESIFYSYTRQINGFAALLDEAKAGEISKDPNVLSVFPSKARKLHTTRSWHFLGLEQDGVIRHDSTWKKARFGEDTIIGNLDTGVWPESESFNDAGLGPVPSKWRGICQQGTNDRIPCNRKLIGARYFNKGYAAAGGIINASSSTPRDIGGHGSHTLSTAGGSFVPSASLFGNGNGTAKGGSPRARVAAYKVCWPPISPNSGECYDADILAAFDAAIADGVDVLSVSLGGSAQAFLSDGIAVGSFHAVLKGIVVVCSAGNDGPTPFTVSNVAPWMITVGASTIDREFTSYVSLGPKTHLKGASLSAKGLPDEKFYPLISAVDAKAANVSAFDASLCKEGSLEPTKVKGKILVCLRGDTARVDKGQQALLAGAVGMILANDEASGNDILADPHVLPASHITYSDFQILLAHINSTRKPMAFMTNAKTVLGTKPAPFMASFSSRGPNSIEPAVLKPDITAPGVNILAAFTKAVAPSGFPYDHRRVPFNVESGTSMSCPHVSGIVGLLKTQYPHWSPAAIKSAIMTTAKIRDNNRRPMLDSSFQKGTPFDYGAGHIQPNRVLDPGLVYDLGKFDYANFLCGQGYNASQIRVFLNEPFTCPKKFNVLDLNYPSIAVPVLLNRTVVSRRVKNVGPPGKYVARIREPVGVSVSVSPSTLVFEKTGVEKKFKVVFNPKQGAKQGEYAFGTLVWSDGKHNVRSPLVTLVQ